MQDNINRHNTHIIEIPGGEKEEQGIENPFEKVMMKKFPNLMRELATQVQKQKGSQSRGTQRGPLEETS